MILKLFISLCNALFWMGAAALLAKYDWGWGAYIKPDWIPVVFVVTLGATYWLLWFITPRYSGEPGAG